MWRGTSYDPAVAIAMRSVGFESAISYGFVGDAKKLAPIASANTKGYTYDMVMEGIPKLWSAKAVQRELPWWLPIPTGWDDRPRSFNRSIIIRDRTPEKFAVICQEARSFCERNGIRHVVIHPINEWQEGSYIEPNQEYGFAMYDAIRNAFCEKPENGWPKNICPSDVGLGPYDYSPLFRSSVQSWDFGESVEGWYRQPYGGGELAVKCGCLDFWINWDRRNFNIRQRVVPFDSSRYSKFCIRMKITPNERFGSGNIKSPEMRLKWGTMECPIIGPGLSIDEQHFVARCPVKVDGNFYEYTIDLSSNPDWSGMIDELWFEACQIIHARVAIDWMRFE
jgi:hypothetical protein